MLPPLAWLWAAIAHLLLAQEPAPSSTPPLRVRVVGAPEVVEPMVLTLEELLDGVEAPREVERAERLDPRDVVIPPPDPAPASGRAFVDLQDPSQAQVYVVDAHWQRVYVRTIPTPEGVDEAARYEIGYVVRGSLEALLRGGTIGVARERAARELGVEDPQPMQQTRRAPARRLVGTAGVGYGASMWGVGAPQHGPRLWASMASQRGRLALGGLIEGRMVLPVTYARDDLSVRLMGGGARAYFAVDVGLRDRLALHAGVGPGVDLVVDRGIALADTAMGHEATLRATPLVSALVGPALDLGRGHNRLRLAAHVSVDVELLGYRYVAQDTGTLVFAPWPVRPGLWLGVAWAGR